jgi:hypothetical protein
MERYLVNIFYQAASKPFMQRIGGGFGLAPAASKSVAIRQK